MLFINILITDHLYDDTRDKLRPFLYCTFFCDDEAKSEAKSAFARFYRVFFLCAAIDTAAR